MLREAAKAIVRAHEAFGRVPKDMEIRQRVIVPVAPVASGSAAAADLLSAPSEMLDLLTATTKRVLKEKDTAAEKAKAAKGRTPRT